MLKKNQIRQLGDKWRSAEFIHIASEQARREELAARKSKGVLICDTDAFTTGIWHERYMGFRSKKLENIDKNSGVEYFYIVTDTDIPFVQDGTRDGEHLRSWMNKLFVKRLKEQNKRFIIVSGSVKSRLSQAKKVINKFIKEPIWLRNK